MRRDAGDVLGAWWGCGIPIVGDGIGNTFFGRIMTTVVFVRFDNDAAVAAHPSKMER